MYARAARPTVERLAKGFPIVAITGPRQSGKTTLARSCFPGKPYVSLENPQERAFAVEDPERFLARFDDGAVLDEIQRAPVLLSYLQGRVDERRRMGDYVLTGSAQFDLVAGITQSLAGRVGRVELLPLSVDELRAASLLPDSLDRVLLTGGYPAIYERQLEVNDWFVNYVSTYIERDVRQLLGVRNLLQFQQFVRLSAARSGQLLNLASLASDAGISATTAREWISILEASYLVTRLPPYHGNFGKRLVKTPKLYFLDAGLMAWLLGIRDETHLGVHAARGALFETFVVSEWIKARLNVGRPPDLWFYRDSQGHEVDLITNTVDGLRAVEIKSGATVASDWAAPLQAFRERCRSAPTVRPVVIYGGVAHRETAHYDLRPWSELAFKDGHLD